MSSKVHVLVVEDSPAQAARVSHDLEQGGFAVTVATDGAAALTLIDSTAFDIVLSDVVMPGMDGYELCRAIKAERPLLPLVLLTSLEDPAEIMRGLAAGADGFLRKPHDPARLIARLGSVVAGAGGTTTSAATVKLGEETFTISADRQKVLNLLASSFEDLVASNRTLQQREATLRSAQAQLREQLQATEREKARLSAVLDAAPQAIVITDLDGIISEVTPELCVLLGRRADELVGHPAAEIFQLVDASGAPLSEPVEELLARVLTGEAIDIGADFDLFVVGSGGLVPVIARGRTVCDEAGGPMAVVGVLIEIGSLSAHDTVTKLPHQGLFADRVARALEAGADTDRWTAIVALTLDHYALLGENLSPPRVESLLSTLADRLRAALEDEEVGSALATPGYFGLGTFAVSIPDLDDELDAVRRVQRLAALMGDEDVLVDDHALSLTFSGGLVVGQGSSIDPVLSISAAVSASRRAQSAGGGQISVADPAVDLIAGDWVQRQAELRTALEDDQLVVHYQPELDLRTEAIWCVEALVRWQHPTRGLLPPGDFLPLAEQSGLLAQLGWKVMAEACAQTAAWRRSSRPGAADLKVSVNLDASQLLDPELADRVAAVLDEAGLEPSALVLEVTESGVLHDAEQAAERLRSVKALGVQTAIDDFGTGYSSLVQLRRLPIDFLKVDREFVDGMTREPDDATIVAATVRLARALGIDSIAEGVETDDQLVQLRLLGCNYGQGYHWARPMSAAELERWWAEWTPGAGHGAASSTDRSEDEASALLDDVLAYLVHEMRSPLTVIAGYADLALRVSDETVTQFVEPIKRAARDLEHRVATLADARDAGQGAMHLVLEEVDVSELVSTLVGDLEPQLAPHPVSITVRNSVTAKADGSRLSQAITNLVVNASKYSPADQPIEVSVSASGPTGEITIRDHGPGVPEERRPEMFRRFARLGASGAGMGVGLHLVRSIARAHGGDAHYEPVDGGGSRFSIRIPVLTVDGEPVRARAPEH